MSQTIHHMYNQNTPSIPMHHKLCILISRIYTYSLELYVISHTLCIYYSYIYGHLLVHNTGIQKSNPRNSPLSHYTPYMDSHNNIPNNILKYIRNFFHFFRAFHAETNKIFIVIKYLPL